MSYLLKFREVQPRVSLRMLRAELGELAAVVDRHVFAERMTSIIIKVFDKACEQAICEIMQQFSKAKPSPFSPKQLTHESRKAGSRIIRVSVKPDWETNRFCNMLEDEENKQAVMTQLMTYMKTRLPAHYLQPTARCAYSQKKKEKKSANKEDKNSWVISFYIDNHDAGKAQQLCNFSDPWLDAEIVILFLEGKRYSVTLHTLQLSEKKSLFADGSVLVSELLGQAEEFTTPGSSDSDGESTASVGHDDSNVFQYRWEPYNFYYPMFPVPSGNVAPAAVHMRCS